MDHIRILIPSKLDIHWPGGGGFQQAQILINGEDLIEIVRKIELPHAEREYDERIAAGESPDEVGKRGVLAGKYLHMPREFFLPPAPNFFGEPYDHGFICSPDDPANEKSILLSCTCGITECWFLLAKITVNENTVTWSDFEQFHRDWIYDFGPVIFDRKQYEAAFESLE
jgi:hypothetical protein